MDLFQKARFFFEENYIKLVKKGQEQQALLNQLNERKQRAEQEFQQRRAQEEALRQQREAQERAEVEQLLRYFVNVPHSNYTSYEYQEVRRNKKFFSAVQSRVFEPGEQGITFIYCEFDKSSRREMKGYLIATNKKLLFLRPDLNFMDKFRYQTIINVNWFHDGLLEKGLRIQYGNKRLEFDEIFDKDQLLRVGNIILQLSSK